MASQQEFVVPAKPSFARRLRVYALLIGYILSIKVPRFAINSLVPFIVAQHGIREQLR
jgi:hypothetical protein